MKGTQRFQRALKRSSPTILTCVAAVGVVVTTVMAVRATPKAMAILNAATDEKGENLTKLEIVRKAGPVYIPAAVIGLSTITCIFGINILNKRNQASLASAYAMVNQSYQQYRKAANAVYGEDADSKIRAQMAKDACVSADGYSMYSLDLDREGERILFFDEYSGRYFTATMSAVLNAQYHLNRNLTLRGDASVNEFYEFIGIDTIEGGDEIGWDMYELVEGGIQWLDFQNNHVELEDGMECYIVSALWGPTPMYPVCV